MTREPTDLDPRLRDALEPTAEDHDDADRIVDAVLADADPVGGGRRRRGRLIPAAAVLVAVALAAGVASWPMPRHEGGVATPPTSSTLVMPTTLEVFPLVDLAYPLVSWTSNERPAMVAAYEPLCPACDGIDLLPSVLQFAETHPDYWVVVVLVNANQEDLKATRRLVGGIQPDRAPVATVLLQDATERGLVPQAVVLGAPMAVLATRDGTVTTHATGLDEAMALLAN